METPPDDHPLHPVTLTTWQWHTIDGTVDNEISVEVVNLDPRSIVETARQIREAGWRQIADWTPTTTEPAEWPPDDQEITVKLTIPQWNLVAACLEKWSLVDERLGHDEHAAASRAISTLISEQTASQAT